MTRLETGLGFKAYASWFGVYGFGNYRAVGLGFRVYFQNRIWRSDVPEFFLVFQSSISLYRSI